jgi:hypothetical protein
MENVSQFKLDGDVSLTVPLTEGFDKVLYDFVQMTVSKSGFEGDASTRIAGKISRLVLEKMEGVRKRRKRAHVVLLVAHGRGHVTIRTTIDELSFSKEEKFQVKAG